MLAALGVYYLCWFRYFTRGRSTQLLYEPLWGVPVPMAVGPAIYFAAASVVLHAPWLAAATVLLSLSHVPLSYQEARRLLTAPLPSPRTNEPRAPAAGRERRVCIVTGANSGIGKATAMALASSGATVVMVCRNRERGETAAQEITRHTGNTNVHIELADLSVQTAIRALAQSLSTRRWSTFRAATSSAHGEFTWRRKLSILRVARDCGKWLR